MIETGKITAKRGLHLRKEPDKHSEILATLPFGAVVNIQRHEGNWLRTSYNFKEGYLYDGYVTVSKVPVPDLDPPWDPAHYSLPLPVKIVIGLVATIVAVWFFIASVWL